MEQFYVQTLPSPLGPLTAGCTAQGICLLQYQDTCTTDMAQTLLSQKGKTQCHFTTHPHLTATAAELQAYFAGKIQTFTTPLHLRGTPFQLQVWQQLQNMPYGKTMSYKQQAIALKNAGAIRAIAHANGANPIMIIIPCHRVVGSNGALTGYKGGLQRKAFLLQLEGAPIARQSQLQFE
jgi:O-6-methylguanine DNA methyltransferase